MLFFYSKANAILNVINDDAMNDFVNLFWFTKCRHDKTGVVVWENGGNYNNFNLIKKKQAS